MRHRSALLALSLAAALATAQEFHLGAHVGDFTLEDTSGATISYGALRGRVTVVAFISAKCPISNAFNDRMSALYRDYSAKDVAFVFVNANANESRGEVVAHAKSAGFPFPVYKDTGNVLADRFGATSTPETYVIDREGFVRYHGYVDDAPNEARVKIHGLQSAIDSVLAGKEVEKSETKAFGCTIKRVRRAS